MPLPNGNMTANEMRDVQQRAWERGDEIWRELRSNPPIAVDLVTGRGLGQTTRIPGPQQVPQYTLDENGNVVLRDAVPVPVSAPTLVDNIEDAQTRPLTDDLKHRISINVTNNKDLDDFEILDGVRSMLLDRGISGLMMERYIEYAKDWMTKNLKKPAVVKEEVWLDKTFRAAYKGKRIKSVNEEIGIEIEAEGKNLFQAPIQWWTAVPDNSLRSVEGHPPIEYVLRQPIERKDVRPALEYLVHQLRKNKSELVMSHRTSVHVHINIQTMKMIHVMNFMSLYYILENVLLEWSGPDRKGNMFCLRAQDAMYQIELLVSALKTGAWSQPMSQDYRYASMNTASMGNHGSLEFRSMNGTVDIETIQDWVTVLTALKDAAGEFKTPESIGRMFNSLGGKEFLIKTLDGRVPSRVLKRMLSFEGVDNMIHDSFVTMKDMIYAIDWNDPPKWMKKTVEPKVA